MRNDNQEFIDGLLNDLRPTRPLTLQRGLMIASGSAALAISVMALFIGIQPALITGSLDPLFLLASGLFLMLGIAASVTVIGMSRPHVGTTHSGWIWAVAMAALLPLTAVVLGFAKEGNEFFQSQPAQGMNCVINGSMLGLIVGGALTMWLRRGAPTSSHQAGLLTGIAAGSLGIFAYSLHCPYDDIFHIGLWHSMAVVVSAIAGRIVVPTLIRW
ncbi:NrsF family protein [Parasphingorhabdus sp.]|uniref:NrsF family protein n=1 Tax=Parasphingorhabdus sp. TaxID=2709688 RepID=UPI0035936258